MAVDSSIVKWILEFLIRQPLEDRTLNSLLHDLQFPAGDPDLQKSLLLRELESDASRGSISETTLELLEQLKEINSRRGDVSLSRAMKRAYCAVAVDCMLKINGLGSELLWVWKDDVEATVWDDGVHKSVVKKFRGCQAHEAVRDYVREEIERMGPTFLELVAERVKGVGGINPVDEFQTSPPSPRVDPAVNGSREMKKEEVMLRDELDGVRHSITMGSANHRGVKLEDSNETTAEPSKRSYNIPGAAEVNKVGEALKSSVKMEPQAAVTDPLPEKLQQAGQDNNDGSKFVLKPSFMEQHNTTIKFGWDDLVDGSPEDVGYKDVFQLTCSETINAMPLNTFEPGNGKRRRRELTKWTTEEVEALRKGVEEVGTGNWKHILHSYPDVFNEKRTGGDLKDKWRNLNR